jgi:outer membrane scaffolding protein for murein synthesis (MipA/OmpV family)
MHQDRGRAGKAWRLGLAAALAALVAQGARAADAGQPAAPAPEGWIITVTGNISISPEWDGAKTYGVVPYPTFSFRRADAPPAVWSAPDDGVDYALTESRVFNFGPVVRYHSGRYRGADPTKLFGIHDVPWTLEPGFFAEYWAIPDTLRARVELRHGLGADYGFIADVAADYVVHVDRSTFALGPRLGLGDGVYMRKQFGVTALDALWNGNVTPYKPQGGVRSVGAAASYTYDFSKTWSATAYGGYDRLIGEAARSPLVKNLGSPDQFRAGLTLSYAFGFKGL